ncbi:MAG: UDP-N-acetylmuramoyl-L-alanine--D-glutamate ligase [Rhodobiaceae bacterium]|nr:UDP-N-acetylmuramoyl-L-alanine--D-glutamate ligase [Rhodobiaceae bacterium]
MMQLPTLSGETAVFGLGRSGLACVAALVAAGNQVVAWDDQMGPRQQAETLGASLRNLAEDFGAPSQLIVSPGVPLTHPAPHPIVASAQAVGCAVLGDMDLFAMGLEAAGLRDKATLIGITGTNGKSTTTALVHHMLQSAGFAVHMGGNIGTPILQVPMPNGDAEKTIYVLELSSYQLDLNRQLSCDMGVMLNLTPDHLDRHGDMAGYAMAKEALFENGKCHDLRVIGLDDAPSREMAERQLSAKRVTISSTHSQGDIHVTEHGLQQGAGASLDLRACPALPGAHNGQNAAAALAIGQTLGLSQKAIAASFESFTGMAHRLQSVARHATLNFVNDSKATNAEATRHALAAFENIYWIAGGVAKAGGLSGLDAHYTNVRAAYLIGDAADGFAQSLAGKMSVEISRTMDIALRQAADQAQADALAPATILLSPACASFDQFEDFEARGLAFQAAVSTWIEAQEAGGVA